MEQSSSNCCEADVWSVLPLYPGANVDLQNTLVAQRSLSPSPAPERRRSRSRSYERDRDRDRKRDRRSRSRSYSPRRDSRYSRSPRRAYGRYGKRSPSPRGPRSPRGHATDDDEVTEIFIRTVAAEVKGHGQEYEESLKEMEKENPRYSFLTNPNVSATHNPKSALPDFPELAAQEAQILSVVSE